MSISLYDVLDVAPDASADEIRAAWRSAVADLDPTDRRFAVYNEAGSVLLDPQKRAAYDAERAAEDSDRAAERDPEPAPEPAPEPGPEPGPAPTRPPEPTADRQREPRAPAAASAATSVAGLSRGERRAVKQSQRQSRLQSQRRTQRQDEPSAPAAGSRKPGRRLPTPPVWALAALGAALVALVAVSVYVLVAPDETERIDEATSQAQSAAERAAVPVLSYDYRSLDQDSEAAQEWMTEDYYADSYQPLFAQIQETAPQTRTVVRTEVVASALVRSGEDRVQVLLFVDRPTRNKQLDSPVTYKDQARFTMQKVGDRWLVDELCTTSACES